MFSLSWLRERGAGRGRPSDRRRATRAVAFGLMAATAVFQSGCASLGNGTGCRFFSPCGFPARATRYIATPFRAFGQGVGRFFNAGGGCFGPVGCAPGGCDSGVVDYGVPSDVFVPGVPVGPPAVVVPGGAIPSTVAPAIEAPTNLEALPEASPGPAPRGGSGSNSSGVRTPSNYDSRRPVQNPGVDLAQSLSRSPSPDKVAADRKRAEPSASVNDPGGFLDNLPELDPMEVTDRADKAMARPAAIKTKAPAAVEPPAAGPSPSTTSTQARDRSGGRAVEEGGTTPALASPTPATAEAAPTPDADPANGAVGVARFYSVDLKLAGGAVPSMVGLGWLAEKGFRTVLDLRDASRIDPAFIAEAARRGLRYVSCPTDLKKLDPEQVDRFSAELALDAARPLYFFDDDGRAAAAMWYVRRVLTDKAAWDLARREAESVGVLDAASWKLTRDYVDSRIAPSPVGPAPEPSSQAQAQAEARRFADAAPSPSKVAGAPARPLGFGTSEPWKPLAALLITGLSFPAAFVGRSVIPAVRSWSRASLPAPAPRS